MLGVLYIFSDLLYNLNMYNTNEEHIKVILDSIADGVFTVDKNWRITSFNRAAEEITGVPRDEAIGSNCRDVLHAECCEKKCALRETLATRTPVVNRRVTIITVEGEQKTLLISTAVLRTEDGDVIGGVETFRDVTVEAELRKQLRAEYTCHDIISMNKRMREVCDILPEIAVSPSTVLIEGESGTGKELVARALHTLSNRSNGPFIAVNCGALPDTLLESELFGHKRGAFTDAHEDRPGRFARAKGGTLFLDEIGDISPAMQMRLLRVLEEKEYEPLGGTQVEKADVRVVTATHRLLENLVEEGTFRRDLFYRINVVKVALPPLRERLEDVPLLVDEFISRFNARHGKQLEGVTDSAMACLMNYHYPGNVRELENCIERAFALCREGYIDNRHLPESIRLVSPDKAARKKRSSGMNYEEMEAAFLMNALRENKWNRLATARALGMHKTTLYRKIKKLGLTLPDSRNSNNN